MCKWTDYISGDMYISQISLGTELGKCTLISKKGYKYVGDIAYGLITGTGIKLFNNGTKA